MLELGLGNIGFGVGIRVGVELGLVLELELGNICGWVRVLVGTVVFDSACGAFGPFRFIWTSTAYLGATCTCGSC